jgi:lysophospholipase L1-like esterase
MRHFNTFGFVFMMFGSSMTQRAFSIEQKGFGSHIADYYSRTADIINRGQGGYNSYTTLLCLDELIGNYVPTIVTLFLGNIDANVTSRFHVPLSEYIVNMKQIIKKIKEKNRFVRIILITPTRSLKRVDSYTKTYVDALKDIGEKTKNCKVLDLWTGKYAIRSDDLCDDEMHLNIQGNKKVAHGIKQIIETEFPMFLPSKEKWLFPDRKLLHQTK